MSECTTGTSKEFLSKRKISGKCSVSEYCPELYLKPCQISMVEVFAKIVNGFFVKKVYHRWVA